MFDQFSERFIVLHFFARNLRKAGAIDPGMLAPETFVSLLLLLAIMPEFIANFTLQFCLRYVAVRNLIHIYYLLQYYHFDFGGLGTAYCLF